MFAAHEDRQWADVLPNTRLPGSITARGGAMRLQNGPQRDVTQLQSGYTDTTTTVTTADTQMDSMSTEPRLR